MAINIEYPVDTLDKFATRIADLIKCTEQHHTVAKALLECISLSIISQVKFLYEPLQFHK